MFAKTALKVVSSAMLLMFVALALLAFTMLRVEITIKLA
jgi:hypothetical protein